MKMFTILKQRKPLEIILLICNIKKVPYICYIFLIVHHIVHYIRLLINRLNGTFDVCHLLIL